jgi:hypothetical protein
MIRRFRMADIQPPTARHEQFTAYAGHALYYLHGAPGG